jgi:signal peptidase I
MTTIEAAPSTPALRPRRPWLAGLLSLWCIGLGQIYNGNLRKAFFFWAFWLISTATVVVLMNLAAPSPSSFWAAVAVAMVTVGVQLYGVVDAVREARSRRTMSLKRYQRFGLCVLGIVYVTGVTNGGFALAGWRSFTIEAASMRPTLARGERLLAQGYGQETPQRGDVVVFRPASYPEQDWLKRIVGLPGDRIQLRSGVVYLNGAPLAQAILGATRDGNLYLETTPEGRSYGISENDHDSNGDTVEWTLPVDRYFVLGDNRGNSLDSRDPRIGLVSRDEITRHAGLIYWSGDWHWIGTPIE